MKLSQFDYKLPKNLIANSPANPRDHSRLLVLNKKDNKINHDNFYNIEKYLKKGDIIVLNNSKVIPARLMGRKNTGGRVELLLSKPIDRHKSRWECILKIKNPKINQKIYFDENLIGKIIKIFGEGIFEIKFNCNKRGLEKIINKIGDTPLPPYISRNQDNKITKNQIKKEYQTVYADNQKKGSIACPTAGLHFTKYLISRLEKRGVRFEYVTLHVGLGTFKAVKTKNIENHKIHAEYAEVSKNTIQNILKAKKEGRRIIACGTTSIRTLETILPEHLKNNKIESFAGEIDKFIYPGYKFKIIDGIITNFHLPKTTLMMLIAAFISKKRGEGIKVLKKAYREAIKKEYRFFSFGDSMLIL